MQRLMTQTTGGTLTISVTGCFDMSLAFDLWHACAPERDAYRQYIFDLGKVSELSISGIAWLMMFSRHAARTGAGVRLANCPDAIAARCADAGLGTPVTGLKYLPDLIPVPVQYGVETLALLFTNQRGA